MASHDQSLDQLSTFDIRVLPDRDMSEEEFIAWCDEDTRAEWVEGKIVMMELVNVEQDELNGRLRSLVYVFVEQRDLGFVHGPKIHVRLASQKRRRVPDVLFVSQNRREIIRTNHIEGPPDLVMEIVSLDSDARDWREKYLEYQAAGVREYWVIDPMSQHVEAYELADAGYRRIEEREARIPSTVLAGLYIRPAWLWPSTRPIVLDALRELGVLGTA